MSKSPEAVWFPSEARTSASALMRLMRRCGVEDYDALRRLALDDAETYWRHVVADLGLRFRMPYGTFLDCGDGVEWPRWFSGGTLNFTDGVLEGMAGQTRPDDLAVKGCSEAGPAVDVTRAELRREVELAMGRLAALGVEEGDRVAVLLPNIVEAVFVTVAAARMGAVVVPLYSGFGADAIASRIDASQAKVLVTCDGFLRNGQEIRILPVVEAATGSCPSVRKVAIVRNGTAGDAPALSSDRAVWWNDVRPAPAVAAPAFAPDHPWMIMFTSGTTGKPKGTVHTHSGFPIRVTHDVAYQYDFHPGDRLFWYSDMGWMIGPLSICATLMLGGCLVLYDGGPSVPDATRLLRVAQDASVTHFGTSPTMLRVMAAAFPTLPEELGGRFKTMMVAGEVIDEETFLWASRNVGRDTTPIINYTGGTEVSGGILTNVILRPIHAGGFNAVTADVEADILGQDDLPVTGEVGELVLRRPMLGMTRGLWQAPERYLESYWSARPGIWSHGDLAIRYENGVWELQGRADDVLKISGRRVGPSEIEEAALAEGSILAAAAIGVPDPISGQAVILLVVGREAESRGDEALADKVRRFVGERLGPGLRPRTVLVVPQLPRTRNGKILRRLARGILLSEPLGDLSSLENPSAVDEIRAAVEAAKA